MKLVVAQLATRNSGAQGVEHRRQVNDLLEDRAADRVRNGPYFARLDEGTEIEPDEAFQAYDGQDYLVSWSRHILDFEEHWAGGSPGEHPLVAEHPEWFIRRSDGEIIGVYTKAFDTAKPSIVFVHGAGLDHTNWQLPARWFAWPSAIVVSSLSVLTSSLSVWSSSFTASLMPSSFAQALSAP